MVNIKSKLSTVNKLRKEVEKLTGVAPKRQRLFHMGKQLEDDYTLFDYDINVNAIIEVSERIVLGVRKKQ